MYDDLTGEELPASPRVGVVGHGVAVRRVAEMDLAMRRFLEKREFGYMSGRAKQAAYARAGFEEAKRRREKTAREVSVVSGKKGTSGTKRRKRS